MLQLLRKFIYTTLRLSLVNTVNFIKFGKDLFTHQRFKHLTLLANVMTDIKSK